MTEHRSDANNDNLDSCANRRSWWSRPCGGRDVLRMAIPLIVSTAVVDRDELHRPDVPAVVLERVDGRGHAGRNGPLRHGLLSAGRGVVRQHVRGAVSRGGASANASARPSGRASASGFYCFPLFLASSRCRLGSSGWPGMKPELAGSGNALLPNRRFGAGAEIIAAAMAAFFTGSGSHLGRHGRRLVGLGC